MWRNPHFFDDMGMNVDETFQVMTPGFDMSNFIRAEVAANPPINFLDLPEDVRMRIYQYSDLIRVSNRRDWGTNMAQRLWRCLWLAPATDGSPFATKESN
jgi:hypothetical protein